MRRAGLDYLKNVRIKILKTSMIFCQNTSFNRIYLVTKFGEKRYDKLKYNPGDCFIFGSELRGLTNEV